MLVLDVPATHSTPLSGPSRCRAKSGEPVVATFFITVASGTPFDVLECFKNACDRWTEDHFDSTDELAAP